MKEREHFELKSGQLEDISNWKNKNFYERLGISIDATDNEIKQAYRKLSQKYHPDKVSTNNLLQANYLEVFQLLNDANKVLSDHIKRAQYTIKLRIDNLNQKKYTKRKHTLEHDIDPANFTEPDPMSLYELNLFVRANIESHPIYAAQHITEDIKEWIYEHGRSGMKRQDAISSALEVSIDYFIKQIKYEIENFPQENVIETTKRVFNSFDGLMDKDSLKWILSVYNLKLKSGENIVNFL